LSGVLPASRLVHLQHQRRLPMTEPRRSTLPTTPSDDDLIPDPREESTPAFHANGVPPLEAGPAPFDIESLRLPQDFSALLGLQRASTTVEVRWPWREGWIRVHDDPTYHFPPPLIHLKDSGTRGECSLVIPPLCPRLKEESTFAPFQLVTAITRQQ